MVDKAKQSIGEEKFVTVEGWTAQEMPLLKVLVYSMDGLIG